jgi:hypothetical protein
MGELRAPLPQPLLDDADDLVPQEDDARESPVALDERDHDQGLDRRHQVGNNILRERVQLERLDGKRLEDGSTSGEETGFDGTGRGGGCGEVSSQLTVVAPPASHTVMISLTCKDVRICRVC